MKVILEQTAFVLSLLISLGTVVTVSLPGIRKKFADFLIKDDRNRRELLQIRELLEAHVAEDGAKKEEIKLQKEVDKCVLRDLITNIYYKYVGEKRIPIYALEDANALFELYRKRGGNSYVHTLVRQMTEEWEVIR
jgi:hypothetical protein